MALPLNVFKTVNVVASTSATEIYTAPTGYTGVVLLASAANVGDNTATITFSHERTDPTTGIAVTTELLKDHPIPAGDSANLLAGKLVIETDDVIVLSASNGTDIKFLGSILETLN